MKPKTNTTEKLIQMRKQCQKYQKKKKKNDTMETFALYEKYLRFFIKIRAM